MIDVRVLTGAALDSALEDVARLRITVFREWPYLYDGDLDYEREYLNAYSNNPAAVLVGAFDGTELIGAATGTPMLDHADEFASAFQDLNWNLSQVFYCAESVLLNTYRGSGIGHRFFDLREEHARALGSSKVAFCAVQRPVDHPLRPTDYRPLDAFWEKRGYSSFQTPLRISAGKISMWPMKPQNHFSFGRGIYRFDISVIAVRKLRTSSIVL
jgi:GNAT superfamily N-acetyltransferase